MTRVIGKRPRVTGKRQMPVIAWALIILGLAWVARVTVFTRPRAPGQFAVVDTSAALQIMIVAMIAGLVVGWWRELAGAILILGGFFAFRPEWMTRESRTVAG